MLKVATVCLFFSGFGEVYPLVTPEMYNEVTLHLHPQSLFLCNSNPLGIKKVFAQFQLFSRFLLLFFFLELQKL